MPSYSIWPVLLMAFALDPLAPEGTPSETICRWSTGRPPGIVPLPTIWPASLMMEAGTAKLSL